MSTKKKASPKKKPTKAVAKKGKNDVVIGRSFTRELPVQANPTVLNKKKDRLAKAMDQKRQEMDQMNAAIAPHRDEIKKLTKEIDGLVADIAGGTENRPVDVHEEKDFRHNMLRIVREDTDEVVEERTMTADDRQEEIRPGDPRDAAPGDDDEKDDKDETPEAGGGDEPQAGDDPSWKD